MSIVLIGAGSTVFTPGLLTDLASNPAFAGWTVHLVDLDADAAATMARLGTRIASAAGADLRFEAHTDRRAALPGARFVATTIAVGGAEGWNADLVVPEKHGVTQTVGDSVGPGGVLRALRHVPALVDIAADVADLAPGALIVNYSNPLTANVRGIHRATGDRHVAEFFPWYLRGNDTPPGRDETLRYIGEKTSLWERLHDQAEGRAPLDPTRDQEAERLVAILASIITGRESVELAVNLPNEGKIPNVPSSAVVEVPAVVSAAGVNGVVVGALPPAIAAVLTARAEQQELTVSAALAGDRTLALQALALDPLVGGPATATAILDDAVVAHAPLLDGFAA
ncbi:hypothetical protein [Cryptosporangium japonicum]|uniref:Glycosyl hydrolase family 4 C-terminal domain-containing protein n=1 Tax=Cryptosporangium japonicum TaxID=80872 RepID=A0ABP3DJS3_9ACTN